MDANMNELHIAVRFSSAPTFSPSFREIQVVKRELGEPYEGPYQLIPTVCTQTIPTKHKRLREDLTVAEIPCHEVSNAQNGTTVIIGGTEPWQ